MDGAGIKRDTQRQQWEESEFPLVCETCLGDNPYLRMTKQKHGKACRICDVPFTLFSWQAGTQGRLKKCEICRNCARTKNVCQVCIYDLQYGLPVQVRDQVLAEYGGASGVAAGAVVPQSDANRSWFSQQQAQAIENGTAGNFSGSMEATLKLQEISRMQPHYERNMAKLCSFFARGECNRGSRCPFRHEMPKDRDDPLRKQNTRDRFYGQNDPVAQKMMKQMREKEDEDRQKCGDDGVTTTLYIKFNYPEGEAKNFNILENDVRDSFYGFGEILTVRMIKNEAAFVEYSARSAAQLALSAMKGKYIKSVPIYINWARPPKRGGEEGIRGTSSIEQETKRMKPSSTEEAGGLSSKQQKKSLPPPPGGFKPLPTGFTAKAKLSGVPRPTSVGVPRPGGSTIVYPSQDPSKFGSR